MTRVLVEAQVFAMAVVDCATGVVEELRFAHLRENVGVGEGCLLAAHSDADVETPPAALAALAQQIAGAADLSQVPLRFVD